VTNPKALFASLEEKGGRGLGKKMKKQVEEINDTKRGRF